MNANEIASHLLEEGLPKDPKDLLSALLKPEDLHIVTDRGVPFLVRMTMPDQEERRNKHSLDDPTVRFYDERYKGGGFTPYGQLASSYYASTLLNHRPGFGLSLATDVPNWNIDAAAFDQVLAWIRENYPGADQAAQDEQRFWNRGA